MICAAVGLFSPWLPNASAVVESVTGCRTATVSVLEVLLLVLHATAAVFFRGDPAPAATFTFKVIVAVPLAAMGVALFVQVASCPTAEQANPPPEPLTNVSPVVGVPGRVSV